MVRFNRNHGQERPLALLRTPRSAVVFVETKRWRRRPAEEYIRTLRPADDASAPATAKNTGL
jgi:hypothetical protein